MIMLSSTYQQDSRGQRAEGQGPDAGTSSEAGPITSGVSITPPSALHSPQSVDPQSLRRIRYLVRLYLGRYAVRTILDFSGLPVYMMINAPSVYTVLREARVIMLQAGGFHSSLNIRGDRCVPPRVHLESQRPNASSSNRYTEP